MSILLTGGAGYIGSHTAVELLNAGYSVVIADDFSNSSPEVIKRVEEITKKTVSVYRVDVADKAAMRDLFSHETIEAVIHFAGFKAVGESVKKPMMYYRNNLDTTLTLLECMKEFYYQKPALVLLDILMPLMDGFEVIEAVRENPAWKDVKIIVLSALNSNEDIVKAFNLGADDFITKPIVMDKLLNTVAKHLGLPLDNVSK